MPPTSGFNPKLSLNESPLTLLRNSSKCNGKRVQEEMYITLLRTFSKLSVRETALSLSERMRKEPHVRSPKEVIILISIFL